MQLKPTDSGAADHVQKSEAPTTVQPVTRAKSNQTKRIVHLARHAVCAIFFSPVYQSLAAAVCAVAIVMVEVLK